MAWRRAAVNSTSPRCYQDNTDDRTASTLSLSSVTNPSLSSRQHYTHYTTQPHCQYYLHNTDQLSVGGDDAFTLLLVVEGPLLLLSFWGTLNHETKLAQIETKRPTAEQSKITPPHAAKPKNLTHAALARSPAAPTPAPAGSFGLFNVQALLCSCNCN